MDQQAVQAVNKELTGLEQSVGQLKVYLAELFNNEGLSMIVTVLVVLVTTSFVSHLAVKLLRRVLSHDDSPVPSSSIFINIARVVVWCSGFSVVLSSCFGIDVSAAVTALGIGGIALSLGFQDTLSNLIGGLQLSIMGIVKPGDHVEMGGFRGIVHDVTWRHTTLETLSGQTVVIPNSVINKSTFLQLPPQRKLVIPISVVTMGEGMDEISKQLIAASTKALEPFGAIEEEPIVYFTAITEFGYAGSLVIWMSQDVEVLHAQTAVVRAIAPITRREMAEGASSGEPVDNE